MACLRRYPGGDSADTGRSCLPNLAATGADRRASDPLEARGLAKYWYARTWVRVNVRGYEDQY